jgi:hypothetical protein
MLVMGVSSGRGRAAVVIAAVVAPATFLSHEVVESTAIIKGEGCTSSSEAASGEEFSSESFDSSRVVVAAAAAAVADERTGGLGRSVGGLAPEPFDEAGGLVTVRVVSSLEDDPFDDDEPLEDDPLDEPFEDELVDVEVDDVAVEPFADEPDEVVRPDFTGADSGAVPGSVGAMVHALALVGLARDEVVDRPDGAGVLVGRWRGGIDGGVDSVMHPPLTGRRRWSQLPVLSRQHRPRYLHRRPGGVLCSAPQR